MNTIAHEQLSAVLFQLPTKNESVKCARKLLQNSHESAELLTAILEGLSPTILDVQIVENTIDAIKKLALTLQKDLLALQSSTKSLASDLAQLAPKLCNIKTNGSRATLGVIMAKLKLPRHRAQESRKIGHLSDSSETLNEDGEEHGKRDKSLRRDDVDGASLSNMLGDLSIFWDSMSMDIGRLVLWIDLRLINGVNQNHPELYTRSTQLPREISGVLLTQLRQYLESPYKL